MKTKLFPWLASNIKCWSWKRIFVSQYLRQNSNGGMNISSHLELNIYNISLSPCEMSCWWHSWNGGWCRRRLLFQHFLLPPTENGNISQQLLGNNICAEISINPPDIFRRSRLHYFKCLQIKSPVEYLAFFTKSEQKKPCAGGCLMSHIHSHFGNVGKKIISWHFCFWKTIECPAFKWRNINWLAI